MFLHLIVAVFVHFRESFLFYTTHLFIWPGLAMTFYLLMLEGKEAWQSPAVTASAKIGVRSLKTAGLFLFFLLFSWQINYLSLAEAQPLMYTAEAIPIRYDLASADLLGYTLRLVLQTWVLALALALVFNRVPRGNEFGCLRGNYQKLSTFAWYVGGMMGLAVTTVNLLALALLLLDVGKFICKSFGADVMTLPQFDLVVFLFSIYMFNKATGFTQKLKEWGHSPNTSVMFVVAVQLLFILFVYCMVQAMIQFLPEDLVYSLMEPFYFDFLDYKRYPDYWQLFVTGLSIFMVPLLANYFYHACKGESVFRSVLRLLTVPLALSLGILMLIPATQEVFFAFSPSIELFPIELNNTTTRYEVSWISYFSVWVLLMLMLMLQRSHALIQALVEVMPEHSGRRVRRMKAQLSKFYPLLIGLLTLYLLSGVVVSLYFSSLFLLATLLGISLCFVAGLKKQEI